MSTSTPLSLRLRPGPGLLPVGVALGLLGPAELRAAEPWTPLSIGASLDTSVGIGTFVESRTADAPYWSSSLGLDLGYAITDRLSVALDLSLSTEWTRWVTPCRPASGPRAAGAPTEDCSDTDDPNAQRWFFSDLRAEASFADEVELLGLGWSVSGGLALPTSRESQGVGNRLTLRASASARRRIAFVEPWISVSAAKFFPQRRALAADEGELDRGGIPIAHCPSFRDTSCALLSGFAPDYRLGADLGLTIDVPPVEGLTIAISVGYRYSRSFGTGGDGLSSSRVDAGGRPIVDGINDADTTHGDLGLRYTIADLELGLGVSSSQPARTADGRSLRFPFFDLVSPANNFTGWYLSVGYRLSGESW